MGGGAKRGRTASRGRTVKKGARQIGYAVVGLGHIAQAAVLPAFEHARNAKLVALVSSDEQKLQELGERYGVEHRFSYEQFEECLKLPEVEAVYIALPNDMHGEFTERAARMGKHVLCEKPMEISEENCERMVRACDDAGVKLMIAYRLHFEPANLRVIEKIKNGELGELRFFSSDFSFQVKRDNIRTKQERGGGVVWDIGIYCINAARYLFQSDPIEVFAYAAQRPDDERFKEVEETVSCVMRFPDGQLGTFTCSFGSAATATYRIVGTKGDIQLNQAYEWVGGRELTATIDEETDTEKFDAVDQFAPELEYFADCIIENREPEPNGFEGWMDVRIIEAIYRSLQTGRAVSIAALPKEERPDEGQVFKRPAVEQEPELVNVDSPSH